MYYPYIRKAQSTDYDTIWSIWMQDHIIQWMSFTKQSKNEFAVDFDCMRKASDIYVLVDKIDGKEKIVGVRRIKFGKGANQHVAEYCSMGIDKNYQGRGYAKFFYENFEKIAQKRGIKRVQLTQSGGNERAFFLAEQTGFKEEAVFPDWLERSYDDGIFHLIERHIYKIIDKELNERVAQIPSLKYQEILPKLKHEENQHIDIKRVGDDFVCQIDNNPLLTVKLKRDNSVIKHIGFLSIELYSSHYQAEATIALKKTIEQIFKEGELKKLEFFTNDPMLAQICRELGFFVRGEKIASYFDGEDFKNELALEYSFFNIRDAQSLIRAKIPKNYKIKSLDGSLCKCDKKIKALIEENKIDELGAAYLENLIYQIVRDELGPNKVFSLADKKWIPLLKNIPKELHHPVLVLYNSLQISHACFFKREFGELLSELPNENLKRKIK